MTNLSPTNRPHARGFTIIELLVVIAIIAVIAGLLLGGISIVKENAKESQAQTVLTNLMGNAGMYETKTTKPIGHLTDNIMKWGGGGWLMNAPGRDKQQGAITADYINIENEENPSYDLLSEDNNYYMERANLFIERFIWAANQVPQIRDNLPALGSAFEDTDNDGFMEVIDPWGNPVAYANGVKHTPGTDEDDDFLPLHDSPFFASAGKDQKWGAPRIRGEFASEAAWNAYKDTDDYKFSVDNLYSFDLDRSAAKRGD
jgi:prepilin-type N-terminal cleavage/methylation domain-containing protein